MTRQEIYATIMNYIDILYNKAELVHGGPE